MEDVLTKKVHGCTVRILQDESFSDSPEQWGDEGLFLVGFHRDFTVERKGFEAYVAAQAYPDRDKYKDLEEHEQARVKEVKKQYHIFGLEAYIHSGVVLALSKEGSFPDRAWDVSQLGAVFVAKKDWPTKIKARNTAWSLVRTWNDCLSGNVYGFIVEDSSGDQIESVWGYIGDYDTSGCLAEAEATAKLHEEEQLKKQVAKIKAYTKSKVPLDKRKAFRV